MSSRDPLCDLLDADFPVSYEGFEPVPWDDEPPAPARPPAEPAVPVVLGVRECADLFGPSRSTIIRLLEHHPAPIVLGTAERVISRWPDEASYREWLREAQRARVPAPAPAAKSSPARRKKASPVSAGGVVDWSAAALTLNGSRR